MPGRHTRIHDRHPDPRAVESKVFGHPRRTNRRPDGALQGAADLPVGTDGNDVRMRSELAEAVIRDLSHARRDAGDATTEHPVAIANEGVGGGPVPCLNDDARGAARCLRPLGQHRVQLVIGARDALRAGKTADDQYKRQREERASEHWAGCSQNRTVSVVQAHCRTSRIPSCQWQPAILQRLDALQPRGARARICKPVSHNDTPAYENYLVSAPTPVAGGPRVGFEAVFQNLAIQGAAADLQHAGRLLLVPAHAFQDSNDVRPFGVGQ